MEEVEVVTGNGKKPLVFVDWEFAVIVLALSQESKLLHGHFRASNLISADHVSIVTCKVPYLISLPFLIDPIFFHPRPPKPKNVAYFPFFDVHAWCCLYLFGPTSRETPLILSLSLLSSIFHPSPPKLKNVAYFSFFRCTCLVVFAYLWLAHVYTLAPSLTRHLDSS